VSVAVAEDAVTAAVEARTELRRSRKAEMIFAAPLSDGITLSSSIPVVRGQGGEPTAADLWVGVRHERVEQLVSEASGLPLSRAGTIIQPVFEVLGDARTYKSWVLREESLEEDAGQLANDLAKHGLPWAARLNALEKIAEALPTSYRVDLAWWRLPAALLLLGRREEAAAYVTDVTARSGKSGSGPADLGEYWDRLQRLATPA
jgi:hypothetical protein